MYHNVIQQNSAMESGDHSKNGMSSKHRTSRTFLLKAKGIITPMMLCLVIMFAVTACGGKSKEQKAAEKAILEANKTLEEAAKTGGVTMAPVKTENKNTKSENQPIVVQSDKEKENVQLVFEDERKTFEIYAYWSLKPHVNKGQYGDEHNVTYSYDMKYRIVNKNDKLLSISWQDGLVGNGTFYYPYEDCYVKNGSVPDFIKTIDYKTGEITFVKPKFDFQFSDSNRDPVKGKQSRGYVKLGDSNVE